MKPYLTILILGFSLSLLCCKATKYPTNYGDSSKEIQVDKTPMLLATKLLGQTDDEFTITACGPSSGHTSSWITYKKYGIAIHSTSYTPEREDGYQNAILRNIGIFDTTNLTVRKSLQQRVYYEQSFYPVSKPNLKLVFGDPDKVRVKDTLEMVIYSKRKMTFVFHNDTKQFLRLFING